MIKLEMKVTVGSYTVTLEKGVIVIYSDPDHKCVLDSREYTLASLIGISGSRAMNLIAVAKVRECTDEELNSFIILHDFIYQITKMELSKEHKDILAKFNIIL